MGEVLWTWSWKGFRPIPLSPRCVANRMTIPALPTAMGSALSSAWDKGKNARNLFGRWSWDTVIGVQGGETGKGRELVQRTLLAGFWEGNWGTIPLELSSADIWGQTRSYLEVLGSFHPRGKDTWKFVLHFSPIPGSGPTLEALIPWRSDLLLLVRNLF